MAEHDRGPAVHGHALQVVVEGALQEAAEEGNGGVVDQQAHLQAGRRAARATSPMSGEARSATTGRVSTPWAEATSEAARSSRSSLRASITTPRPRAPISWESASPVPVEAPATTAQGP